MITMWLLCLSVILASACSGVSATSTAPRPLTFSGVALYDDGTPANGAMIRITDVKSNALSAMLTANSAGYYSSPLAPGKYSIAVAAERGFAWVEAQDVPATNLRISLSRSCYSVTGHVTADALSASVSLERQSFSQGDIFVAHPRSDGRFVLCLPEGQYRAFLTGDAVSVNTKIDVPGSGPVYIRGVASSEVKRPPSRLDAVRADIEGLVADIGVQNPRIVGLGEATHGTAEFVSARGKLTFELIHRLDVRLLLFEFDAIAGAALDDYVNGADIDPAKAVAGLRFWITDTYEFLQFLGKVREYNVTTNDKVHIWGIDLQNTTLPVEVLLAKAEELSISADDQETLKLLVKRGKGVKDISTARRSSINALLRRISVPRSAQKTDLVVAVAAQSLAIQLDYWIGDMTGWLYKRRDIGMATLVKFLVAQFDGKRACLWAHDGHITRQQSEFVLGHHLSMTDQKYYAVAFYLYKGSARAVDTAGEIGVVSYLIPEAPRYTLESIVMELTGKPEVAWLPLSHLPESFERWLTTPRFARELGAVYLGMDYMMTLRDTHAAFDALVVIRTGHDSTPTPTGVRIFKH